MSLPGQDPHARPDPTPPQPTRITRSAHHPLNDLAEHLDVDPGFDAIAQRVVDSAVHAIGQADWASITKYLDHWFVTAAATDEVARRTDQAQYDTNQGPCLSAAVGTATILHSADTRQDRRWPIFGPRAHRLGVNSILSCRIEHRSEPSGSVNLYSAHRHAFTESDEHLCRLLALAVMLAL